MLRLIGIVISIGLADSLNPSTVAPALFMAAGEKPRRSVAQFAAGVFAVYFFGGLLIALGPGAIVLSLVPRPSHQTTQVLEVLAGVVLISAGLLLWRFRKPLACRPLPLVQGRGQTGWALGASITAIELPTAFPYFGALAAIVGSGLDFGDQLLLVVIFNVCFVAPLGAIWLTLRLGGTQADAYLDTARKFLERHWPLLLAGIALVAGAVTIGLGATGTVRVVKGSFKHGFAHTITKTLAHAFGGPPPGGKLHLPPRLK